MKNNKDLEGSTTQLPSREEIQKRAYELYSNSAQNLAAEEYWLMAEEQLKQEQSTGAARTSKTSFSKSK